MAADAAEAGDDGNAGGKDTKPKVEGDDTVLGADVRASEQQSAAPGETPEGAAPTSVMDKSTPHVKDVVRREMATLVKGMDSSAVVEELHRAGVNIASLDPGQRQELVKLVKLRATFLVDRKHAMEELVGTLSMRVAAHFARARSFADARHAVSTEARNLGIDGLLFRDEWPRLSSAFRDVASMASSFVREVALLQRRARGAGMGVPLAAAPSGPQKPHTAADGRRPHVPPPPLTIEDIDRILELGNDAQHALHSLSASGFDVSPLVAEMRGGEGAVDDIQAASDVVEGGESIAAKALSLRETPA